MCFSSALSVCVHINLILCVKPAFFAREPDGVMAQKAHSLSRLIRSPLSGAKCQSTAAIVQSFCVVGPGTI
jgi:hypothetical protein